MAHRLRVKKDKAFAAWQDLAPPPLTLQQPKVQEQIRQIFQTQFDTGVRDATDRLRQAEPNASADDIRRRAVTEVE